MSSQTIALVAIILASLFWATAGIVAKILLRTFDPFTLAFLRFFIATLVILPIFLIREKRVTKLFSKKVLLASIFSKLNITFFYLGLTRTTANASAMIYTTTPLIVAILGHIYLKEKLTLPKTYGILIGFVGVLLISILPIFEKGQKLSGDFWGNVLVFIASICWAFYTLVSRRLQAKNEASPLTISTSSIVVGSIAFFAISLLTGKANTWVNFFNWQNFWLITHLAILVTVATLLLYQWAIKHTSAVNASLNVYIQPVFAIILAILILGEQITFGFVVGSLLVIAGVLLATGTQLINQIKLLRRYFK